MKIGVFDSAGATQQVELDVGLFRAASETGHKHGLSKLNHDVFTAPGQPTAAQQIYAQMGFGSTNLYHAMSGEFMSGAVTEDGSIAGRLAMQAYLMDATENKLRDSDYGIIGLLNSKAAMVDTINSTKFDRPQFDYSRPEAGKARTIAQLSEPAMMLSITTSDRSYKIAGTSIGMEISDEASKAVKLDLVALAMTRQAEEAAIDYAEGAFLSFLQGDADAGMAALSGVTAKSFDASIVAAGVLTQEAWMKFLFTGSRHRRIDTVITDFAGALAIEKRAGRPVVAGDNGTSPRIDTLESIVNPTWAKNVQVIVSQDPTWPANTICAFDSRYGYHVVNSSVLAYNALEQFAIRRSTKVRVDTGILAYRLYDQAWSVLTLTV